MRIRVPHTLVLLFGMIVAAQCATYLLPKGEYREERIYAGETDAKQALIDRFESSVADDPEAAPLVEAARDAITKRKKTVPGSFAPIDDAEPLPWYACFSAIPEGFGKSHEIIFFVFLIGGAFGVFRMTGAADALIGLLLAKLGARPALLIGAGLTLFAAGSSSIGMAEEYLPFVPMLIALCIGLGFDAVTAVGILCCGYATGYGMAAFNPFTVVPAQNIAGIDEMSGWGFRVAGTVPFLAIAFHHVYRYARRVKSDPSTSLVADVDYSDVRGDDTERPSFTAAHGAIIALIIATIAFIVYGSRFLGFYLVEMGAIFVGLTVLIACVARLSPNATARGFCDGATELTTTALLIGFARTIEVILVDGKVIGTIIHAMAGLLGDLPTSVSAVGMLVLQSLCNFFIPSGSGQAFVTMPIMAPLGQQLGVTEQTAVLAYQMGDGFTNILVPTNAVLIGILTMARIPYDRWLRFVLPFMLKVWVLAAIVLLVATWIGYA